jgi:hypothetical protein
MSARRPNVSLSPRQHWNDMENHQSILKLLQQYLDGLYAGNVASLREVFDPDAALYGEVKGETFRKPLDVYLGAVANRNSAQAMEEPYRMRILSVEVVGEMASAKVHVPMLGSNFYNFLSMLKRNGRWAIVNKLYAHVEP